MCGISGVYHYRNNQTGDPTVLANMLQMIQHRGPDEDGVHLDQNLAFGMRRLSIIDLAGGKQPIFNETGDVVIVFNGEIYNYVELRETLRQRGHTFATASDTEVIVHLYEEMGEACVEQLRGMFAFAIWDTRQQKLLIARDRLGIKPLYYLQLGDSLVFSSEIKSLLQYPGVTARLHLEGLSNYLSLKYVPAPHTMFDGILSLPPGHLLTCDANGVKTRAYWDLSFVNEPDSYLDEEAYAEQLLALLRETVKIHLRSDVPFGAFLSGGLDSSLMVALMSQFLDEPVKTFTVGFASDKGEADERAYARLVAQQFHTDHHEIVVGANDLFDLLEKVTWHLDQPIADQATIATYMVAKLAREHVKMVLTGEGGDELFAGYARYAGERLSPWLRPLPGAARSLALRMGEHLPGLRRSKIALYALCQADETARLANWFPLFNRDMKMAVLASDLRDELTSAAAYQVFGQHLARTNATAPLNRMLYVDTKLWLPDYLLLRGDKLTMANSLEARVPLLDHKVVEFAAALPPHLKLKGLTRKYLLKKVGRSLLPPQVIDRKKQGFPIPISSWLRKEARVYVHDLLSPMALQRRGLFDVNYVGKLLSEHERGFADHGMLLWGLLNVELWHRLFIDKSASAQPAANTAWLAQGALRVLNPQAMKQVG